MIGNNIFKINSCFLVREHYYHILDKLQYCDIGTIKQL